MPDFLLPDLGEGLTEAEIVAWRVDVGDELAIDQVVVEVETAKATVEVPIPFAGTVAVLHAQAGEAVAVGSPLISVTAAERVSKANGFQEPGIVVAAPAPNGAEPEGSGNVLIGFGTPPPTVRRRRARPPHRPAAEPVAAARVESTPQRAANVVAVSSPLVRKIARDAALDLATIAGTGPAGLVTRRDVIEALATTDVPAPPEPAAVADRTPDIQRIPLRGLRKAIADKLTRSRREIPEATVWVDVDATQLLSCRAELNRRDPHRPVSVLALLSRFTIAGLRLYPELNGRVEADEIVLPTAVHLGFAAQTERGLVVPVVHDAHRLSTRDLSVAMSAHTSSARAGSLTPADLAGGTFTVNNYGVFGVDGSAAIINHPEVAILGIGRIIDKPWVFEGALAVRKVTQLTLAFDHRVCDGATAGGFLRFVADCVETPAIALGEL